MPQVLALDIAGQPRSWISYEEAAKHYAEDKVAWTLGKVIMTYRGGWQNSGERSVIEMSSIIAVRGKDFSTGKSHIGLSNRALFTRDRHLCAYCGQQYNHAGLSRDHIMPKSRGGRDTWMNCVTACKKCNSAKDDKLLSECGFELLYAPYVPNHFEALILQNRHVLSDQMDYLMAGLPKHSRVLVA